MDSKIAEIFPYLSNVLKKSGYIVIDKNMSNKTKLITDFVNNRKQNEGLLSIAPDGFQKIEFNNAIAPFKTGAFVDKFCILPVVIKYKYYKVNPENVNCNLVLNLFEKPLDLKCEVILDVMNPIQPKKNISIEEYKNFVHKQMSKRYNEL
jgi:hypothetical protein